MINVHIFRSNLNKILLLVIFITLSTSTVLWVKSDLTPPPWDPADHISTAYDYYRPIAQLDVAEFNKEFFTELHYYAPFVHLVTALAFLIFGASKLSAIVVNLLSLAVILTSTKSIYEQVFEIKRDVATSTYISPGVLASLLACCYHFPAWLLHDAFLDYPLIAIVTLSFALLLKTGNFTNRKYSIAFGITLGLGMLTKQTFTFFLFLPLAYSVYKAIRSKQLPVLLNILLAATIGAGLAAIWYVPHLHDVIEIYRINKEGAINENEAPLFSFMSNVFYAHALISAQLQVPFALLFITGLTFSIVRLRKESIPIYLWLISGIFFFTMVANKDIRYTIPILPAVALLSVCWLSPPLKHNTVPDDSSDSSRRRRANVFRLVKASTVIATVAWAFVSFFTAQWPQPGTGYYLDTPNFRWMVFARNYYGFDHRPLNDDWSVPAIVRTIVETSSSEPRLSTTVNLPYFNPSTFTLYSRLMTPERAGRPLMKVDSLVSENDRNRVKDSQYLVIRTGLEFAEWEAPLESYAEELIKQNPDRFEKLAAFPIPLRKAEAVLYKRRETISSQPEISMKVAPMRLYTR